MDKKKQTDKLAFQSPKGMHDILPPDQLLWDRVRKATKEIADAYNFLRIDTTLLEDAALFEHSLGFSSDVVEKEMYALKTKGGDVLALRPEATASVARAYIEHGLAQLGKPLKLFYIGPMFRHDQPQAGRYRQFHQTGFEILGGDDDSIYDAQIILVTYRLMESLRLKPLLIKINSIGCRTCRPVYRKKLIDYYKNYAGEGKTKICKDCERRLEVNPLRLLDCKNPTCQTIRRDAPISLSSLCSYCKAHFKGVLEYCDELKLPYLIDHFLVRGLDYYNRTVFEVFLGDAAQADQEVTFSGQPTDATVHPRVGLALGGGGRYDYLIEMLGGRETAAVGSAIGLERLVELMRTAAPIVSKHAPKIFLIHMGDLAKKKSLSLIEQLRHDGIDVSESLGRESLKSQLRVADKLGAAYALIFGQKEALEESVIIRDLQTGAQETVPLTHMSHEIKRRIK